MENEIEQLDQEVEFDAETEDSSGEQPEVEQVSDDVEEDNENSEPELIEIEYEGEKYHVPPELKDAFERHSDYTRKTQTHAEQVREFEQQRQAFEQERQLAAQAYQRQQANQQAYSQLMALDSQLEQYKQVNWAQATEQDPVEAQKAFFQYNQLRDQRDQLAGYIQQAEAQTTQEQQAYLERQLEQGRAELARDIPNWSPELAKSITETSLEIGLSKEELSQLYKPAHVKALYYAQIGYNAMKKANAAPKQTAKPTKSIKSSGSNGITNMDNLSVDDWMKARRKQVANR